MVFRMIGKKLIEVPIAIFEPVVYPLLTGIAAALLARRGGIGGTAERARLAVFVHAMAGDLAAAEVSETALLASDIARTGLPRLFRRWER